MRLLKDSFILLIRTYEYSTLYGRRNFAGGVKLCPLGLGEQPRLASGACLITASFKSDSLSQLWEVVVIREELLERCSVASLGLGVGGPRQGMQVTRAVCEDKETDSPL